MANLFDGKTLHWAAYDPSRVIATAVHSLLKELLSDETSQHFTLADTPQDVPTNRDLGLAVWRVDSLDDWPGICAALATLASRNSRTVRIAYLSSEHADRAATLVEAGAQIVVSQLPSLQSALRICLSKAHFAQQSFHPLTSHLVSRLPWPELDDDSTDNFN